MSNEQGQATSSYRLSDGPVYISRTGVTCDALHFASANKTLMRVSPQGEITIEANEDELRKLIQNGGSEVTPYAHLALHILQLREQVADQEVINKLCFRPPHLDGPGPIVVVSPKSSTSVLVQQPPCHVGRIYVRSIEGFVQTVR